MLAVIRAIGNNLSTERVLLETHVNAINERNLRVLRLILMACMVIFGASFLAAVFLKGLSTVGYVNLRVAYFTMVAVCAGLSFLLRWGKRVNPTWAIYAVYVVGITYCVITSALVSPNYVSVVILAVLFQIPVLYIDKSLRIDAFVLLGACVYLLAIMGFKNPRLFPDEVMNVAAFSAIGLIIGKFTRGYQLENLAIKAELQSLAYTDQLTMLYNRRRLFEDLTEDEAREVRTISGFALIDIDFFKNYNDTYGHQAGDDCLHAVAGCFARVQARYQTVFYRYGGEEFLAVLKGYNRVEMVQIATEIQKSVEVLGIAHEGTQLGVVTISVGVAVLCSEGIKPYAALLSEADKALYEAKSSGRNRAVLFRQE